MLLWNRGTAIADITKVLRLPTNVQWVLTSAAYRQTLGSLWSLLLDAHVDSHVT